MSDNLNVNEEDVFPWKEKMRQAGQGDTGSVLELCEEIRPIVEVMRGNKADCRGFQQKRDVPQPVFCRGYPQYGIPGRIGIHDGI